MPIPSNSADVLAFLQYVGSFPDWKTAGALSAQYPGTEPKPDRSNPLRIVIYLTGALVLIFVPARIVVRTRTAAIGLDDILIIPAFILTLGLIITLALLVELGGLGKHVLFLPYEVLQRAQKLEFAAFIIYYGAILCTKLSITLFLRRLFPPLTTLRKAIIYGTMTFYILLFTFSIFLYFFSCKPIMSAWNLDSRIKHYYFLDVQKLVLIISILYAVGDLWLLLLPIYTILQLNLNWQRKGGLVFVFSLGGIACAGAVLKCFHVGGLYRTYDPTWNGVGFVYGVHIESAFGIISASLPALHSTFISFLPANLQRWYNYGRWTPMINSRRSPNKDHKGSYNPDSTTMKPKTNSTTFPSYWADTPKPFKMLVATGESKDGTPNFGVVRKTSVVQTFSHKGEPEKPDWQLPKVDMYHANLGISPSLLEYSTPTSSDERRPGSGDSVWVLQGPTEDFDVEAGMSPRRAEYGFGGWHSDSISKVRRSIDEEKKKRDSSRS